MPSFPMSTDDEAINLLSFGKIKHLYQSGEGKRTNIIQMAEVSEVSHHCLLSTKS